LQKGWHPSEGKQGEVWSDQSHVSQLHHHARRNTTKGCQSLPHQEYDFSL
jgi:hypothetical protein